MTGTRPWPPPHPHGRLHLQVDVDGDVPVRVLHLQQRMEALDPSVCGEQDVDAAEFLFLAAGGSRSQGRQVALVKLDAELIGDPPPGSVGRLPAGPLESTASPPRNAGRPGHRCRCRPRPPPRERARSPRPGQFPRAAPVTTATFPSSDPAAGAT